VKDSSKSDIKTFVIDTNVFIHRPDAILSFRDNEIVIPIGVLEELDRLKSYSDERGRNARHAIRFLDSVSQKGNLSEGVKLENGSMLRVIETKARQIPTDLDKDKTDNRIILGALLLNQEEGRKVFFVSKDINARVKATALGIKAVDYEKQKVNIDLLYKGYREVDLVSSTIQTFQENGEIEWKEKLYSNEYIVINKDKEEENCIGKLNNETGNINLVRKMEKPICGINPLNPNQRIAFDLLLDDSIPLVTLVGKAGTGKTLLAIATGLHKVLEENVFTRVLVSRPVIPMGKDIGFLPGSKEEKLSSWMQPLFDNLEYILSVYKKQNLKSVESLMNNDYIEIEALTYIRGRSLPKQYIIIDEAQNLSPHEIKTIVSRAGEGTKIVLTGDPYQIDSPYLDSNSNGLTYLVEIMKGQELFGHIFLDKSERSPLAELAAELL